MRRVIAVLYLLTLALPLAIPASTVEAQTPTPYPLPNGWGPAGGIDIMSPMFGYTSIVSSEYCQQALLLENWGYYDSPDPILPLRLTQYFPSGYARLLVIMSPYVEWEIDYYQSIEISTYTAHYLSEVGSSLYFISDGYYLDGWRLFDVTVPVDESWGGMMDIMLTNRTQGVASSGYHFAGLYVTDSLNPVPDTICNITPPTVTPTPTPSHTPLPTPTGTITQTWTPTPSPTLAPTTTMAATGTSTPTPQAFTTWTPAPTSSPFPSLTPIPGSMQYGTPAGGWGTPSLPTLQPMATVTPLMGFTPNATFQARYDDLATAVAESHLYYSRVITLSTWAISLTVDASGYYTGVTSTGTITNPTFFISQLTLPLAYAKGIVRFMPNLGPMIIFLFAAFLFMVAVRLIKLAYIALMWSVEKVERLWQALPFT